MAVTYKKLFHLEFVTEENFDEGCNENQRNGEAKIL